MKLILIILTFLLALGSIDAKAFNCSVATTSVSFSNYDVFSTSPTYSTGTVSVSCSNPNNQAMPVTIAISSGSSGTFNPRRLKAAIGTDSLNYYLFTNPSRTVIWGDGTGGTSTVVNSVSRSAPWNASIYGTLPQRQNVSAGSYGDSVVVTVSW
jgi:spore coat protein U-like protein